jgi:hypothetical protein
VVAGTGCGAGCWMRRTGLPGVVCSPALAARCTTLPAALTLPPVPVVPRAVHALGGATEPMNALPMFS